MVYQVHIQTWENDGDDYATKVINCITEADVRFYLDLASRFKSTNAWKVENRGYGNEGIASDLLLEVIANVLDRHPDISTELREQWSFSVSVPEDDDAWDDAIEDEAFNAYTELTDIVLGSPFSEYYQDEHLFCRVFESAKVFEIPQLPTDVTEKFIK